MSYSIILPVYNEENAILDQVNEIIKYIDLYKIKAEIIIIDDGSNDSTLSICKKIKYSNLKIHSNLDNLGYGFSIKKGVELANYENIIMLDADMTYPFSEINKLILDYEKGFDLVIGERKNLTKHDGLMKGILRQILILIVNFISGIKVPDPNSGYRIFKKNIFVKYDFLISNSFSMSTSSLLCFVFNRSPIKFIKINYRNRIGQTKVKLSRDIFRMLQAIFQVGLYFNTLKIYMVGFILFALITTTFFIADYFLHYNLMIYKLLFLFFSIQFLCFGFIAEALRYRK
tara:strand:+ start:94 stop:954 length:861 start_codon:yes stop_codon:yes gene_type:complete